MIVFGLLFSTLAYAEQVKWSENTAHTLPSGRWEIGFFSSLRYGWSESTEIQLHPIGTLLSPHLAIKQDLLTIEGWNVSLRQSVAYPTLLLQNLARGGIGGIIPPDSKIPHIVSSDTRLLATTDLSEKNSLTMRLQLNVAPRFGESDFPHIPVPVVYPRIASYKGGATIGLGTFTRSQVSDGWEIHTDTQLWWMMGNQSNWAVEQWLSLKWFLSPDFNLSAGLVGTMGAYPYGANWHLIPTFNVSWAME